MVSASFHSGGARRFSSGFAINDQIYIGLGVKDNETAITRELYAYDIGSQEWSKQSDYPGDLPVFRDTYGAFVVGEQGYLVVNKEIWRYSPENDIWTQMSEYPGIGSSNHVAQVIDGLVYLGLGFTDAFDWWRFDPTTNGWLSLSSYPGEFTWGVRSFQINKKVYVVGKQCWEYDVIADQWIQRTSHPDGRRFGLAFAIGDKGYFGTGISTTRSSPVFQKDLWEYLP